MKKKTTSIDNFNSVTGGDKDSTRAFLQAMNVNALPQSRYIVDKFDFANHKFIDIGAGYGTYSVAIAKKYENVQGIAFDLPMAAEIIEENVQAEKVEEKVRVLSGTYKKDLPNDKFDDAFLFAVIHQEDASSAEELIKDAYTRLKEGGRLFVTSFFLDDTRTEPEFSVLFGVEMLVASEKGKVYSHSEIQQIIKNVGFSKIDRYNDIPGPATLYVAVK
jgi:demethylspheroidene O-methyltransferase